ncbi:hypothetical protein E2C01_015316 [Portunus trituberculatus]|uniref:Uncharacterized protein n=1 Tax=Portunus trituberculatus TaxID=210409 RepID=A0A5B7DM92_PORTR|nr:hypothetical protein [Portunus trituberculatus]
MKEKGEGRSTPSFQPKYSTHTLFPHSTQTFQRSIPSNPPAFACTTTTTSTITTTTTTTTTTTAAPHSIPFMPPFQEPFQRHPAASLCKMCWRSKPRTHT